MSITIFESREITSKLQELDELYNITIDYENEQNSYLARLFTTGLDNADIRPLEKILNDLIKLEYHLKQAITKDIPIRHSYAKQFSKKEIVYHKWDSIIVYEKELLTSLGSITITFYKILKELKKLYIKPNYTDFIRENASLLLLVSTNNYKFANIKKISDDAFFFCCQFHEENTPSMRVNAHNNRYFCYGCGKKGDIINYIMQVEGIDRDNALALLAAIFKIKFRNNPYNEDSELVKKYTNPKALANYKRRLETGYKRASDKEKSFNNYLALENYEKELALLERIKTGTYIKHPKYPKNKALVHELPPL